MPSPPTRRLAFGLDLGPSGTYSCVLHLAPLLAEPFGCVSDARTFSLVFLSAGFGALCSGVSSRFCLSAGCIIDISVDQLCGSLHESEKCVRARRETSPLRFYPMARVGFRETWVRMPHGSTYPSPSSCGLQGDKAGRQVCPPELRTPQPCAVLQVQMRKAHGTQDVGVLFVREYLVAPALPKRVMVSDRPHLLGLPRFGVLNHPYRWLTWTVKPVSPPSSTGRPSIRVSG